MTSSAPSPEAIGFLGLARRAGAAVVGLEAVRQALRDGGAQLVVLAGDAAPGQLHKLEGLLANRDVPVRWMDRQDDLGAAVGRAPVSAVAVMKRSFAEQLLSRLPDRSPPGIETTVTGRGPKEESSTDAGR